MSDKDGFPINRWGAPVGDGVIHLHDLDFNYEGYFEQYRAGSLSQDEKEEFSARVYGLFCRDFYRSDGNVAAIQPWVANFIANKLFQGLGGVPWNDIMNLPWDRPTPLFTSRGERALEIYGAVETALISDPNAKITSLIAAQAEQRNVSYETARGDYYAMRTAIKGKAGIPAKFLKPESDS